MAQLRKAADRKRVHRGSRTPTSLQAAAAQLPLNGEAPSVNGSAVDGSSNGTRLVAGMEVQGDGPMVVREKLHSAEPMSLDQALMEMELVGHDFFLFIDCRAAPAERGLPPPRIRLWRDPARHLAGPRRRLTPVPPFRETVGLGQ